MPSDETVTPETAPPPPSKEEVDGAAPATPETTPVVTAPPPVAPLLDDRSVDRLGQAIVAGLVQANAALRPPPALPGIDDVTDDEINAAAARGEPVAHLVGKRARAEVERAKRELQAEINGLRQQGAASLAVLSRATLESKKYYKDYKHEIDSMLGGLPAEQQADPRALENIYRYVISGHTEEIEKKAEERALRSARETAPPPSRGGANGRDATRADDLDPLDVLGADDFAAAKQLGDKIAEKKGGPGGVDAFARQLGYASTQAFLKSRAEGNVQ